MSLGILSILLLLSHDLLHFSVYSESLMQRPSPCTSKVSKEDTLALG